MVHFLPIASFCYLKQLFVIDNLKKIIIIKLGWKHNEGVIIKLKQNSNDAEI